VSTLTFRILGDVRSPHIDVFKYDPDFLKSEDVYKEVKAEVLGEDSDEEDGSGSSDDGEDEAGKKRTCVGGEESANGSTVEEKEGIQDKTETNLVNLRRIIYLTIMNAVSMIIFGSAFY
jgi:pre-mRNA-splicing factor CWC22